MAHNMFFSYTDPTSPTSARLTRHHAGGPDNEGGTVTFWGGHHAELEIEAKGHGIYAAHDDSPWYVDHYEYGGSGYRGDYGTTYYPGTSAEVPSSGNDRNVEYALISLDEIWDRRYPDEYPQMWASYGAFKGNDDDGCGWNSWENDGCQQNAAHAPWAMHNIEQRDNYEWELTDPDLYGTWFEHPADLMDAFFGNANYDASYAYRSTGGVWESLHDYQNDRDYVYAWTVPGASSLSVTLTKVKLDAGDSLRIEDSLGNPSRTFPAHTDQPAVIVTVPGDTVVLRFEVNGDGKEWGFFVSHVIATA